jgi:uncharacterized protein YdhG (YjbR/CyaY superfamily)
MNPSERIDALIAELTDSRRKTLASIRKTILQADREIIEEWKWMGSPAWSRDGMIAVAKLRNKMRPQAAGQPSQRAVFAGENRRVDVRLAQPRTGLISPSLFVCTGLVR